jgi:F0F1-type ATP synthase assembly protein I
VVSVTDSGRRTTPGAGALLGVGSAFGGCVGLGLIAGILGDKAAGTSPLLVIIGLIIGIVMGAAGAYGVIRPYVRSGSQRPPREG